MARIYTSKEDIEDRLTQAISKIKNLQEDGVQFRPPSIQEHEADTAGCNWSLGVIDGFLEPYFSDIARIVNSLRQQYSIKK